MSRPELAELRQPSMAGVFGHVVGVWGSWFVSIGLIVSVLGAYLAWSAARRGGAVLCRKSELVAGRCSGRTRSRSRPRRVWLTNIVVQLFLILTLFAQEAFNLAWT